LPGTKQAVTLECVLERDGIPDCEEKRRF